jgi:hypothetical protein
MMMTMTGDKRLGLFFDCWVFARCPGLRLGFCFLVRFCWLYCSPTTFHPAKALTAVGTVGRLSRYLIRDFHFRHSHLIFSADNSSSKPPKLLVASDMMVIFSMDC